MSPSESVPAEMRVCQQETPPPSSIAPSSSPESLALIDSTTEGASTAKHPGSHQQEPIQMTVDILPDDVLVYLFRLCLGLYGPSRRDVGWRKLARVCQRWRNLVFGSPLHLDVKLPCTARTSLRATLDVWPTLPISIKQNLCSSLSQVERKNILAILELHQRVCEIDLTDVSNELLDQVGQVMQKPFPILTKLLLESSSPTSLVLPDSFLGGSAPRLRVLELEHIPFPALPNLLMSTTGLRHLYLSSIPLSSYVSSQVMVTCLSQMTRLEKLVIGFYYPRFQYSRTSQSLPSPPMTRTTLPALTHLCFQGRCKYLEDLVASIDAPLLDTMSVSFFKRDTYNMPQLSKFISCTIQLRSPRRVDAVFYEDTIKVKLYLQTDLISRSVLDLEVFCRDPDQGLSSLTQLCQLLSSLSTLERLDIRRGGYGDSALSYNIENARWLELLRRFAGVKDLHITEPLGLPVMSALAVLAGDGVTVLPALQNIFLEGLQQSGSLRDNVDQLIAARQTISVHHWNIW